MFCKVETIGLMGMNAFPVDVEIDDPSIIRVLPSRFLSRAVTLLFSRKHWYIVDATISYLIFKTLTYRIIHEH